MATLMPIGTLINSVLSKNTSTTMKMKKYIFIIAAMFLAISANAQIVVNSRFKPMTFDEMAAPLIMAQRFQQECLNNLDALAEQTEQAEQFISKEKDPTTWKVYADCYNSIIDEYNSILKNGTNRGTRKAISDLRRQSSSLLASIKAAYDRRNRLSNDQYARLRAVDGLMCNRFFSDISIDEFMNGKTPTVTYQTREEYNATQR